MIIIFMILCFFGHDELGMCKANLVYTEQSGVSMCDGNEVKGLCCSNAFCMSLCELL